MYLLRIEYDNIRKESRLEQTTITQMNAIGRKRSHFPNGLLETEHVLVTHIMSKNSRKRTVTSRMGFAFGKRTGGGHGAMIDSNTAGQSHRASL